MLYFSDVDTYVASIGQKSVSMIFNVFEQSQEENISWALFMKRIESDRLCIPYSLDTKSLGFNYSFEIHMCVE